MCVGAPFLFVVHLGALVFFTGKHQPGFNLLCVSIILIQLSQSNPYCNTPIKSYFMLLEHYCDFSEWVHSHSQWQNASLSGQHERDGWVQIVDDELCCMVEVQFSVVSYLNWQAATAAIWLNSHTLSWYGRAGRSMRENCSGQWVPLIHLGGGDALTTWCPQWKPGQIESPLKCCCFRRLNNQGHWVATGEVRKKQNGNIHHVGVSAVLPWKSDRAALKVQPSFCLCGCQYICQGHDIRLGHFPGANDFCSTEKKH